MSYSELLHWISLWTMMSTVAGTDHHSFWSMCDIKIFSGCFFTLSTYMSCTRFKLILQHLKYTTINPPTYKDRFWEVCEMLEEWNKNMAMNFVPSWINCIDELMSKWLNEYTCPGFMFVPHKPWPLVTNTMMQGVPIPTSFGPWNCVKERTDHPNSTTSHLMTSGRRSGHSYG